MHTMETERVKVIMALGCNVGGEESMRQAQLLLAKVVEGVVFTATVWTEPVGMVSGKFLNCLAMGRTAADYPSLRLRLKRIEGRFGATKTEKRAGRVAMDIDILQLGGHRYHEADWQRPYVQALLRQLLEP